MVTAIGEALPETGITPEFIIGITGHRDVAGEDVEGTRAKLRALFQMVSDTFQHVPVRIATGLAEGANTIARRS